MGFAIATGSSRGTGGKIVFSGFGLVFAMFGCLFVASAWDGMLETKAMQQWADTPCTIVSSEMQDAGEDYKLVLSYSYIFDGQTYTAERYGKEKHYTAESVGEIDRMKKTLPPGKQTRCHVNPEKPAEAVLKLPAVKGAVAAIGFTLIFPAFGMLFASLPWLGGRKKKNDYTVHSGAKKEKKRSAKWFLIPFGAVFVLVGLIALKPLFITPLQKTHNAKTWDSVPATVVSSKVKSHSDDDGTTYSVYIAYRYEIDGEEFLGDRYTFMGGSSRGRDSKAGIVRRYPTGRKFNVYVNPVNPFESVIQREFTPMMWLGLIPLIFVIAGIAGIAVMIGGFRAKTKLDTRQAQEQIVTLKGTSPAAKASGLLIFTLIWNGVVVLIFKSEAPILFHIVFGFFGLIMIAASIHAILALFNPRPIVEITPGNIRPGTSVAMRWRTNGNIDRIEKLTISLQCLKITAETTRRGGKSHTTTIKTPQHDEELLQTDSQPEIAQGTLQFQIPEEVPPSRPKGFRGEIRWQLVFHGDIKRWPDLKEELPFTVYPSA
ncbi:MAG: DUF3592 domain-containing protein [Kiritimatiellales bacterium]|nr:DUF3592 domain-containing protein [Kiritimatiellales bacterium]